MITAFSHLNLVRKYKGDEWMNDLINELINY